ncbi:MAG: M20/M25/M40 family metallo-hydrolase [Bradyrhizobium sp.]|uniref:M20/M25/M40 family metallo-hydrolase n=1 Tax=Bradyrhizobium sp. TaxID=376 RepID=UPI001D281882|nr:M20/M25/M40 family metallo-hydrolase [Bradyrhizobium sp.]MBV9563315.1 M20/M25/M40 family metallo-hydrolase [Bradyrhizobium sp.]
MTKTASNLQIDSARLWGTIHETATFGATPKGGVLTPSAEDTQVRDWFRKACDGVLGTLRRDALATLSEIVLAVEAVAKKHRPNAVGTVGEAVIASPSRNVILGEIAFTADLRIADGAIMDALDKDLRAAIAEIAARRKVEVSLDLVWCKPQTHFNPKLVDAVQGAAEMLGYSHRRITSGAGHHGCNLNTRIPAAMVFVPCKDGVSHNELEDATQSDCAAGANVLMHTVLALAGVAA